jgi:hypothetical protein
MTLAVTATTATAATTVLAHVSPGGGASGGGSALASWRPFTMLMVAFAAAVVALFVIGRGSLLLRIPNGLERLIRVPGWAAATVGLSLFGLLVAGQGFYSDVAWHVALGRDNELFTAPHTAILVGLALIFASGFVGIMIASLQRVDTTIRLRNGAIRVPWSTLPLIALGTAAVSGFPLDELWHEAYGIDVTMWSPTHMLMILGAASTGMAGWLVFSEAGVDPKQNRWSLGVHVFAAWLTLQGLSAPLGEFAFGVPQFQQMFHPVLVSVAAGFALVAMRLVLGPRWALGITVVNFALMQGNLLSGGRSEDSPVDTRMVGLYIVSAAVVELVAWLLGTRDRTRFAVVSGLGIGTIGLAGEWMWNLDAYQPWRTTLLPDAVVMSVIAATGAALLATAFARAAGHQLDAPAVPRRVLALAGLAVVATIVLPLPRTTGDVEAALKVRPVNDHDAHVEVTLTPPDAADEARWFQASAWQGGALALADMKEVEPGRFVTEEPVPVAQGWKTIVRLHRGSDLMTVPVYLPADPEIDEPEIPAVDRTQAFEKETKYLLRETHAGAAWFAYVIYALLLGAIALWIAVFCLTVARLAPVDQAGAPRDLVPSA